MSGIPKGWTKHQFQGHPAIVNAEGVIVERIPDWPTDLTPGGAVLRYRAWSAPEGMTMGRRVVGVFESREDALAAVLTDNKSRSK